MAEWTDERVETLMGRLLQAGVSLAAGVVLTGGAWYLLRHGAQPVAYHTFKGEPQPLRSIGGIVHGLSALNSRALIQLGLLLLIATPVARVVFSVIAFARQRDRAYVLITMLVLGILVFSLAGGIQG